MQFSTYTRQTNGSTNEQPSNNVSTKEQPSSKASTNERPSNNVSTNEQPSNNVSTNEWPSSKVSTNDRPSNNVSTNERPSNNVQPNNNRSTNESSYTLRPIRSQLVIFNKEFHRLRSSANVINEYLVRKRKSSRNCSSLFMWGLQVESFKTLIYVALE